LTQRQALIVAVVAPEAAEAALVELRAPALRTALIGELGAGSPQVNLDTAFGGQRTPDEFEDDPLPCIC
jgi:hydrogenase maturation factor